MPCATVVVVVYINYGDDSSFFFLFFLTGFLERSEKGLRLYHLLEESET